MSVMTANFSVKSESKQIGICQKDYSQKIDMNKQIENLLDVWNYKVQEALGQNVVGIYLTGSLTYGDFVPGRSDLDLSVVTKQALNQSEISSVRILHQDLEKNFPDWSQRIECSYIPLDFLPCALPPETPRPWWGFGVLYEDAPYGNEWLINKYFLWKCSVALFGPAFSDLVSEVKMQDVQEACARDLYKEWVPKINDDAWLSDPHQQSYVVLNICRILYTVKAGTAGLKTESAGWVSQTFPQWTELVNDALNWKYDESMDRVEETKRLIGFAAELM